MKKEKREILNRPSTQCCCEWRMRTLLLGFAILISVCSFSQSKKIARLAKTILLKDSAISTGHIGISIYEPATDTYWYNYNGDKYFIPASNTKLFTLYAGMKYLGDSLVGARVLDYQKDLIILPAGDPTFLNEEFKFQPLLSLLKEKGNSVVVRYGAWQDYRWGNGWAWNDYQETYMAEKSAMPMYGNIVKLFSVYDSTLSVFGSTEKARYHTFPKLFSSDDYWSKSTINYSEFIKEHGIQEITMNLQKGDTIFFKAGRNIDANTFYVKPDYKASKIQKLPFATSNNVTNLLLSDTLNKKIRNENIYFTGHENIVQNEFKIIHSQPSDSLFKPMMYRSDNFFAEQTLLMASNEYLGYMSDEKIIDTLLKSDLKDAPQKPKWVDGSGLSRYNLFTPQSFVYLLNKIKNEFGWQRIKNILPTGGTGTLASYYKKDSGFIYAKTGTLSNNCALSGYLITENGKLLIFSVLANNYITNAVPVRKAVEQFLLAIRKKY
jgi:D-alanyl-D-alanine carboxypeptidase/D-alanyl-D-alanine-endopeptidase (penicillin-binding protein 4)